MTAVLADGLQIVPGYRLEVRLGKGGFGEVWRAIGPGKVPVALKIIAAKGSQSGEREFKSLDLLRDLRHPNLLPVQAYWLLDDDGLVIEDDRPPSSIVIAMLLGGKNLRQRLDECRKRGIAGIPPRELLELLRDAAKGIDFLNKPIHKLGDRVVAIQHRDIKPENLMIVGGGLMVADFGISGVMESDRAHTTNAAMTFNYAAPELFDYTATAWTDQYALAITYGELRCGALPFPPNSSPMQIIRIHTEGRHDFSRLSAGEQAVLRRATDKVPEQRYPTCQDMLADLDAAVRAANLLDEVLPSNNWGDQSHVPTELQATRLERGGDTDPATTPMLSAVTAIPGLPSLPRSGIGTSPLDNNTGPLQLPATQPESMPLYSMPTTAPYNAGLHQLPRSRTPLIVGGAVAVIAVAGLIAWSFRGGPRESPEPGITNREPKAKETEPSRATTDVTPSSDKPTPAVRLAAAREQAAAAAKEKRYSDVVKALEPVFEQASATSDDYVMRGNSCLTLADADVSPADNYARAAADFEKADLPREQQRALTRQGRWLVDHNFAKQALVPLRQAFDLKKTAELQWLLCQALLATGDAKSAREEAVVALAEFPKDLSDDDALFAARLHHIIARACLALSKQVDADADLVNRIDALDLEAEQHFQEAVTRVFALARTRKLVEPSDWQDELSAFRKLPRMVAREERRLRKERIATLTKSAELSPEVAAKWLELAELEKLDGQTKSAATHFGRGYSLQALTQARAGKIDDAIKAEALATENEADLATLYSARALIAASQERDRDALKLLDEARARTPTKATDRWQILSDRAAAYSRLAAGMSGSRLDWEKSQTDFESAIASFPTSTSDNNAAAQQTLARLHFEHALTWEALSVRDSSKVDLSQLALAEKALFNATTLNPKEPRFALAAGQNLLRQVHNAAPGFAQLLDRAAVLLTTATKLDDKQAEAHFALGDCQLLRGKNAEAQAAFDNAVKHAEGTSADRQFQFSLSQSLAYLRAPRDDAKALAAAERAVALQRSDAAGHFARGLSLRNLKRVNEAISAFNDTIAVQPKHLGALLARSQLIIEHQGSTAKQIEQAAQDIETALAAATTDEHTAEAHYVRSLVSLKTHVSNATQAATAEPALLKAQRDLLQAIKLVPTNNVYAQAATELFDYASKFAWADAQRKTESETLQRDLKSLRKK